MRDVITSYWGSDFPFNVGFRREIFCYYNFETVGEKETREKMDKEEEMEEEEKEEEEKEEDK